MTPVAYHDATKHHVNRFARSLGYLDWATQPAPFRSFAGAPEFPLFPRVPQDAGLPAPPYGHLFERPRGGGPPLAVAIGDSLRHALGLSAWKSFRGSRWALRVNPSSGNLHPTEAYLVTGPAAGLAGDAGVYHYAPDRHALELRCRFDPTAWREAGADWLVVLTSVHWREAWKYGERAFRYCQHDLGHAIAALRFGVGLQGRGLALVPEWPQDAIGALAGVDRDADYEGAEREEPACLLAVGAHPTAPDHSLLEAVRAGDWTGRASALSRDRVEWSAIDEIAAATRDSGRTPPAMPAASEAPSPDSDGPDARSVILQRRSAVAFDAVTVLPRDGFLAMLARAMPGPGAPWDAMWWSPRVHLALFVHRVEGVAPGLYLLARDPEAVARLRAGCRADFEWARADDGLPLYQLARGDCRRLAAHLSCDQDIAADGCFSLGMIVDFARSLDELGASFYRHLFWETGMIGQVLYLEAEAAGLRGTGIGCFFDDEVHDVLGLDGHAFQSLYHFTVGGPVDDPRLANEAGYGWET